MELDSGVYEYQSELPKLDPIESVRQRPGMYVGDVQESGAFQALQELIANSIDQFLKGDADLVRICHDGLNLEVYDNGSGFPMSDPAIAKTLTDFHDKPTADDHAPHVHLVLRGVGLYPVNALSARFTMQTVYEGESYEVCFEKGRQVTKTTEAPLPFERGTRVIASLDTELFQCETLHGDFVRKRLLETAHLFPGLSIELNEERFKTTGLMQLAEIYQPYSDYTEHNYQHTRRVGVVSSSERLRLNVALVGEATDVPTIRSWVNGTPTPKHGSHVDGVLRATRAHDWLPQTVLVSVVFNEVEYAGPTRDQLCTGWVTSEVANLMKGPLEKTIGALG